jgi:hypothetical protein
VQVWVWILGTVILVSGVGLVQTGHAIGDPVAAIGSFVVLLDMLLFGWLVYQGERAGVGNRPLAGAAS